jgi:hypothetical protein
MLEKQIHQNILVNFSKVFNLLQCLKWYVLSIGMCICYKSMRDEHKRMSQIWGHIELN